MVTAMTDDNNRCSYSSSSLCCHSMMLVFRSRLETSGVVTQGGECEALFQNTVLEAYLSQGQIDLEMRSESNDVHVVAIRLLPPDIAECITD